MFLAIRAVSGHLGGSPGSTGPPLSGRLGGVWVLLNGAKHSSAGLGFRFCRGGGNQAFRPLEQYLVFSLHFDHIFAIFSKSRIESFSAHLLEISLVNIRTFGTRIPSGIAISDAHKIREGRFWGISGSLPIDPRTCPGAP